MDRQHLESAVLTTAILVSVVLLAGCTGTQGTAPVSPMTTAGPGSAPTTVAAGTTTVPGAAESVSLANNRFAFDLYSQLAQDPSHASGNLFFSPFSVTSAFAVTCEGARGATAAEIRTVFHFPENATMMREGFRELMTGINLAGKGYSLRTANALFAEKTYPFLPAYTSIAQRYYSADTANLDFISQPEASRGTINRWVENQTENRIRDLVPPGVITPLTRLVITNAVYFRGSWVAQFDANLTSDADFLISPKKTVRIRMMERTGKGAEYAYAETGDLQAVRLPYGNASGHALSMLVVLPKGDTLAAAEQVLETERFAALMGALKRQRVDLYLPKFTMETSYRLPDTLSAMGMPTAFSMAADLSGMDGTTDLYIGDAIHKAFVDVGEEGTEAAAATAVVIELKAAIIEEPVPVFRADHPFLFLIQDEETGAILFLGRLVDPSGT